MLETDSQNLITNNSRNDTSSHDNTNTLTNNIISSTNKRSNLIRKTKREATRKKSKQTKSISYDNNNDDSNPSPNQNAISQNDINEDDDDEEASDFDIFDTDGNGANNNVTELLVGADHEYKTIQSAINVAKGKTIIKIDKGIYRETIQIKSKKDTSGFVHDINNSTINAGYVSVPLVTNPVEDETFKPKLAGFAITANTSVISNCYIAKGVSDGCTSHIFTYNTYNNENPVFDRFVLDSGDELGQITVSAR